MTTPTRELVISYDGLTVGAGTQFLIDGKVSISTAYGSGSVSFDLVVTAASEAALQTACQAVIAAGDTPRGRILVVYGSTTHIDWNPATNSGFNQTCTVSKAGSPHDTGRSRRFRVTMTAELPYDLSGSFGRGLVTTTNLTKTDSGRMRLFLQGSYRALSSNGAREQYEAQFQNWAAAIMIGFGGTWDGPFDVNSSSDDADKNISFSQTYEELIFNESAGVLADPRLHRQKLHVMRLVEAPGDSQDHGSVVRLESLSVIYEVAVDRTQTQDLVTLYQTVILPYLISVAKTVTKSSVIALVAQDPGYDFPENRLNVSLSILAAGSSNILSSTFRSDDSQNFGIDLVGAWTGDSMSKHQFQGLGKITRTVTQVWRTLSTSSSSPSSSSSTTSSTANPPGTPSSSSGSLGVDALTSPTERTPDPVIQDPDGGTLQYAIIGISITNIPLTIGYAGGPQIQVVDRIQVTRYEYYVTIDDSSSGGKTTTGSGS